MKLTKSKLKKIILEEMRRVLKEQEAPALNANQMRKMANALCFKQGRVWFGGRTTAESNANMAKARRNSQWRCPANDKLGFKDWSDARKLAGRGDSAAFQQFIQSKKGGAPGQQGQQGEAAQGAAADAAARAVRSAEDYFRDHLKTYQTYGTPELKANFRHKMQKGYNKYCSAGAIRKWTTKLKWAGSGREASCDGLKMFLKQIEKLKGAGPKEREFAANLQGKEGAPQKPDSPAAFLERSFDCKLADNAKLGTKWKVLLKSTRTRKSAGHWNPLAPITASLSHKELHDISKELLAAAPWLKTNKIKLAKGCELPVAKLYKALERQLKQLHSKKRSTPPHTIKYRTEGKYIIATATTKDKKHSAEGRSIISFDNEEQAKANAQGRATQKLIRKTHEEQ